MKPFRQIDAGVLDASVLRDELDTFGYLLIRNAIPKEPLNPLLEEVVEVLDRAGWLASVAGPSDRIANENSACADGDASYKETFERVFRLQSFHALPHHPALQRVMKMIVGPELLIHPKSAARLIFPNYDRSIIHAHQDHTAVSGDTETFTAWMPLHDCPEELGPLRILEGSHFFGLQPTAGRTGYIPSGAERGGHWVGGQINAGDVLIFHSLTVHQAAPNRSDQLRISLDCRFQNYLRPVNPGALVFTGSGRRSWESTYQHWKSDELKYYWTSLPLHFKPSRQELADLAQIAEPFEMRERYARILERIDALAPVSAS